MAAEAPRCDDRKRLHDVVGYLNFSEGAPDPAFHRNLSDLYRSIDLQRDEPSAGDQSATVHLLVEWLRHQIAELDQPDGPLGDVSQAKAVLSLVVDHFRPAYRDFHRDLLWSRRRDQLWTPFFFGRVCEVVLAQGPPWPTEGAAVTEIITQARDRFDDYLGYRPVPVLETEQKIQPYRHEWVRPIPLYIEEAGVAHGDYAELIETTLSILQQTDPGLMREAWLDLALLEEIALDPRPYDFDHPVNKRPNYHFGQWDPNRIDGRGFYRRFVLQPVALNALMQRVNQESADSSRRDELLFEAGAVLAGTMLMASGTSGDSPNRHDSEVTLSTLLPHIARYRDQFYEQLLATAAGSHGERLRAESVERRQPLAGARQHLNGELARLRADQLQQVHLAQMLARMGYSNAAQQQASAVRVTSARMLTQIYCRLTDGHRALDRRRPEDVAQYLEEIEDLLQRGIECGALVDPWNIIGFGGNFSLFPAIENSVHDYRVDDLIHLVEQTLDLASRAWTEAAAVDNQPLEETFDETLQRIATWWDQYATPLVAELRSIIGSEVLISTNLVAGALNAWHKAGAAAGDVGFWRMFVDQFDTPKAFQLVIEALLDHDDHVASMALMLQWVSQADRTPLEDGDALLYPLADRWLRMVEAHQAASGEDQWPRVAKFFTHLEASAEDAWRVPQFELGEEGRGPDALDDLLDEDETPFGNPEDDYGAEGVYDEEGNWLGEDEEEDELDNLFSAAYEDMTFRDSQDDGMDSAIFEPSFEGEETQYELEEETERISGRLNFLVAVARLWKHTAIVWGAVSDENPAAESPTRQETLEAWQREATARYVELGQLLEAVHTHRIPTPRGAIHEAMVEYDRRRVVKDALLEQIIVAAVEMSDAGRLLRAAAGTHRPAETGAASKIALTIQLLRSVLAGDPEGVRQHWPEFCAALAKQDLLYIPLGKGGAPGAIVKARALHRLIDDLAGWLPRLGMVRETCELLDIAQRMEVDHPVGKGAVTEYDRLFENGYQSIVRCLTASATEWDQAPPDPQDPLAEVPAADTLPSDMLLVQALQDLTERQLNRWLRHSKTVRLSVVEQFNTPRGGDPVWTRFVTFVKQYGQDLFTQRFLSLANLRAILHQGVSIWLTNLIEEDTHDHRLLDDLGSKVRLDEAADLLGLAIETVVENYREYRDYNSTTTQSDHGELLYTFVDFMRLRNGYDRIAWNLKPVFLAHDILVRGDRPAAAGLWRRLVTERTDAEADARLQILTTLEQQYSMRLPTVRQRLAERFVRPLTIDRLRALVRPVMQAVESSEADDPSGEQNELNEFYSVFTAEIAALLEEPHGAGLDAPDWITAIEEEVTIIRYEQRRHVTADDSPLRYEQVRLGWEELQEQLLADGE